MTKPATDPHETTAARILQVLAAAGVGTVFGLPGAHNLSFWRGSDQDDQGIDVIGVDGAPVRSVRIVGVRHEQTAAFAADGLARATGGLGVALVTSGPGAANTGIGKQGTVTVSTDTTFGHAQKTIVVNTAK